MLIAYVKVQQRINQVEAAPVVVGKIEQTAHDTYAWTSAGFRCLRSSIEEAKEAARKDYPKCQFH
jgi:hypothetical protein